ncbi:hypothetical protein NUU61_004164 [Penicillium alfredii]|uniref:Uncharacterized protein n=1 Tax=Penicillium alfredii TaxID=1506179 RepID=A0A9W9KED7_9EURO|nr:uncharacterized protein NUU61_004164 [Penicillium alfredii]KAJ5101942.1 hypothetical protein NUU61_004164 [Penicillium alfredii]
MTAINLQEPQVQQAPPEQAPQPTLAHVPLDRSPKTSLMSLESSVDAAPITSMYEGYTFFQADPIPGRNATWTRVERTQMHLNQSDLFKMVQKRATKISATQQFQALSKIRQVHVNQLIDEQRRSDSRVEWSCVYAKECARSFKARNARRGDYETVSMDIILLKRPMKTRSHPRTPMGDLVDLRIALLPHANDSRRYQAMPSPPWYQQSPPLATSQPVGSRPVVQGPLPRPTSFPSSLGNLDQVQHPSPGTREGNVRSPRSNFEVGLARDRNACDSLSQSTTTVTPIPGSRTSASANGRHTSIDSNSTAWSSKASNDDDDDESMLEDSDGSSATNDSDETESECEKLRSPNTNCRQRSCSPSRSESGHGPYYRRKSKSRSLSRRYDKRYDRRSVPYAFNTSDRSRVNSPRRSDQDRYRARRMDDDDIRTRMLDHREARLEHWEKFVDQQARMLRKTMDEARQLERRNPARVPSTRYHCDCCYSQKE